MDVHLDCRIQHALRNSFDQVRSTHSQRTAQAVSRRAGHPRAPTDNNGPYHVHAVREFIVSRRFAHFCHTQCFFGIYRITSVLLIPSILYHRILPTYDTTYQCLFSEPFTHKHHIYRPLSQKSTVRRTGNSKHQHRIQHTARGSFQCGAQGAIIHM